MWSFQTEGAVWGTPLIDGATVYIGSDDGNLYAIHAVTGQLRWKFATEGLVRSQPATAAGLIYLTSDDGFMYAVDAQAGQQVWRTDIGNFSESEKRENPGVSPDPTGFDYLQSAPVFFEQQVYAGSADGNVYALAADTGKLMWTFRTAKKIRATPSVTDGTVYIGSWDGTVYALDASTGLPRWQTPIGGAIQTTALVSNGLVYTASRKASLVALDAQTGSKRWEYDYGPNAWVESSPRLAGNVLYIGSSGNRYVLGLDSQTGELLTSYQGSAFFWSSPLIVGDTLFIGAEGFTPTADIGGLYRFKLPTALDAGYRRPMELDRLLALPQTLMPDGNWAGVASSPVLSGDVVYFGALDGKLYAVGIGSGCKCRRRIAWHP